ncbi:MAG TPA: hypothetical protein VMY41_16300 [Thermohalobaculum sp.]|nr:hypothetical protein [Thermohalobaculum sp.]
MKLIHFLNAGLWLANAVVWFAYAGVPSMAVASLAAAGLAVWQARQA